MENEANPIVLALLQDAALLGTNLSGSDRKLLPGDELAIMHRAVKAQADTDARVARMKVTNAKSTARAKAKVSNSTAEVAKKEHDKELEEAAATLKKEKVAEPPAKTTKRKPAKTTASE